MNNLDSVAQMVKEKGIEFFLCSFVEMAGIPKAKLVPVEHLRDMASGSAGFAGFCCRSYGTRSAGSRHDCPARFRGSDAGSVA